MNKSEQLIACLEGEIAKRDARIMGLESQYQRDVYGLNNEGDPIGGDPAGGYANDNARLRAELAAIKAQEPLTVEFMQFMTAVVTGAGLLSRGKQSKGLASELSATAYKYMLGAQVSGYQQKPIGYRCWFNKEPKNIMVEWGKSLPSDMNPSATYQALYAAPVSEAKAKGVVQWPDADEIMQMAFEEGQPADDASGYCFELEEFDLFIERLMSEVARLNSPPVSAGEPVPATIGLTEYTYREALKTLREVLDPDDWMGEISMHAFIDAALSAPSHSEQVRCSYAQAAGEALIVANLGVDDSADSFEQANKKLMSLIDWNIQVATDPAVNGGFKLVPIEPQGRQQFNAAFNLCSEFGDVFVRANKSFAIAVYREMVKAAPSAGSQKEQGE